MTAADAGILNAAAPDAKAERRRAARAWRDAMPAALREEASSAICRRILALEAFKRCDTVFGYSPVGSEADIRPVIAAALAGGKHVALPVCDYAAYEMEFYEIGGGTLVENGPLHIPEPPADPARRRIPAAGTLILVPGLLFDRRGYRIGYGKGMYDRYIRRFPDALQSAATVGVTYHALLADTPLPTVGHDVGLAMLVTERELVRTRKDGTAETEARQCRAADPEKLSPTEEKNAPPRAGETER